jgi:NAD(P)-dependent dehydrogenase (short-subunit alcohol dehydrogenase family)
LNNLFDLQNKNILITGATSNIGIALSKLLVSFGANLILLSRNFEKLQEIKKEINNNNVNIFRFDLSDDIKKQLSEILIDDRKIHGFVHIAGISFTKPLKLLNYKDFESIFKINVYSALEIIQVISHNKYIDEQVGSSYVLISSIRSKKLENLLSLYSMSKSSLNTMAKALAIELANKKIRVNSILPAYIENSGMYDNIVSKFDVKKIEELKTQHLLGFLSPNDVANSCLFLLSNLSTKITGTNIIIDSGFSLK